MNPLPTPQKKPDFAPQQESMEKDVMDVVKRKGKPKQSPEVEKAKEQLRQYIKEYQINPQTLIQVGELCNQGLRDPVAYQMAVDMAVKNGLMTQEEIGQGTNYKLLGYGITLGKMTEELVAEGL